MSTPVITQAEFQALAETRLREAQALLSAQFWSGAYYLSGYAVELALKANVIRRLKSSDAFPEKNFSARCYTHDLRVLLEIAGLVSELNSAPVTVQSNWATVFKWTEQSRYSCSLQQEAEELVDAIAEPTNGVLTWILQYL